MNTTNLFSHTKTSSDLTMEESYNSEVRPILETFDKIREVLGNEKIDLPSIVVIGI
jgi:DNA phosphorothioation-dependent restriction protein DptG